MISIPNSLVSTQKVGLLVQLTSMPPLISKSVWRSTNRSKLTTTCAQQIAHARAMEILSKSGRASRTRTLSSMGAKLALSTLAEGTRTIWTVSWRQVTLSCRLQPLPAQLPQRHSQPSKQRHRQRLTLLSPLSRVKLVRRYLAFHR